MLKSIILFVLVFIINHTGADQADVLKDYLIVILTSVNLFLDQTCTTFFEQDLNTLVGNLIYTETSALLYAFSNCRCM